MRNITLVSSVLPDTLLAFALCLLCGCTQVFSPEIHTYNHAYSMEKSSQDHRTYHDYVLPNQIKVVLISDPTTELAAAALNVQAGSADNPGERPGLAHFLEHMLFLGTEKYPDSGSYQSYIHQHGGSMNAYTAFAHTNYFFDIDAEYLEPALDRFSQFFIAPLFNTESLHRERNIVDSEFTGGLKNDGRRMFQVLKEIMHPEHPQSRFAVGNAHTLRDIPGKDIRQEVMAFFAQHYSANRMQLVVLGKEPIAELKQMVTEKFHKIRNKNREKPLITQPLFDPAQLPADVYLQSVKQNNYLHLFFPVPPQLAHYRTNASMYIAHLLGYEGKGSLLSYLKQRQWAEALSTGLLLSAADSALFQISIELTDQGKKQTDAISAAVFAMVQQIRQHGLVKWRYQELAQIQRHRFHYAEPEEARQLVTTLAERLAYVQPSDLLTAGVLLQQFDRSAIAELLDHIRPERMLRMHMSPAKEVDTVSGKTIIYDRQAQWYNTPYSLQPYDVQLPDAETSSLWHDPAIITEIHLPEPNPFVSKQHTIIPHTKNALKLLHEHEHEHASEYPQWYQADSDFHLPKGSFYLGFLSPDIRDHLKDQLITRLWLDMMSDQLQEITYDAALAGIQHKIYLHSRGLTLQLHGFTDKQDMLLTQIGTAMHKWQKVSPERFATIKQHVYQELENQGKQPPANGLMQKLTEYLVYPSWSHTEKMAALSAITLEQVQKRIPELLQQTQLLSFTYGNYRQEQAVNMNRIAQQFFSSTKQSNPTKHVDFPVVTSLQAQKNTIKTKLDHPDQGVLLYVQGRQKSIEEQARMMLLAEILRAPFYHSMRTEQELGYSVFSFVHDLFELPGMVFIVQSRAATEQVAHAIQKFLTNYQQNIQQLHTDDLNKIKQSVITRIRAKYDRFDQRSNDYWYQINLGHRTLDTGQKLIQAVQQVRAEELAVIYQTQFSNPWQNNLLISSEHEI